MANGKKEYSIIINGIKESVSAVDSLNKQLDKLEERINRLSKQNVNINTGGGNTSSLSEEDKIQQQILATEQKIAQARSESYQQLVNAKAELKEMQTIAQANAASKNNALGLFDDSTMLGMKEHLKSIKQEMQTMDVGSEGFRKLQQDANELNSKLKEIEQGYGQFGRNVGNYAEGVAEGMSKVIIKVGDTERTFNSAKEASRTLNNELKSMAVNGQQNTKEYGDLNKAVKQLNSTLQDTSKSSVAMDNLLDTMQSVTAIASMSKGLSAVFGFDDDKLQKSVQQLLALQNVMQSLETINQQIQSGEGIGGWISKGNEAIDAFVAKLTGANKAQEALNASTNAGKTASQGLATAQKAQAGATTTATVATKALSLALKTIGIGLVISAVAYLITYWKEIYKWFTDTVPALKNLSTWFDKIKAVAMGVGSAITNFLLQPIATLGKVIMAVINGDFSSIPNIIGEGLKKTYDIAGNYQKGYQKQAENDQKKHLQKRNDAQRKANEEALKDEEAKYGKSHKRTQEYYRKQMALVKKGSQEYKEYQRKLWEDERQEREENQRKQEQALKKSQTSGRQAAQRVKQEAKKTEDATRQAEDNINSLKIKLMKEGLNKELAQLAEQNRQEVAKIKQNGQNVKRQLELQAEVYKQEREKLIREFSNATVELIDSNELKEYENQLNALKNTIDAFSKRRAILPYAKYSQELAIFGGTDVKEVEKVINKVQKLFNIRNNDFFNQNSKGIIESYFEALKTDYIEIATNEVKEKFAKLMAEGDDKAVYNFLRDSFESMRLKDAFPALENELKDFYGLFVEYGGNIQHFLQTELGGGFSVTLAESFDETINIIDNRQRGAIDRMNEYYRQREKLMLKSLNKEQNMETNAVEKSIGLINEQFDELRKLDDATKNMDNAQAQEYYRKLLNENKDSYTEMETNGINYVRRLDALYVQLRQIPEKYENKRKELHFSTTEEIQRNNTKYYDNEFAAFEKFLSKADEVRSTQPTTGLTGFIDIKATKKQYKEVLDLYKDMLGNLDTLEFVARNDSINEEIDRQTYEDVVNNITFYRKKIKGEIKEINDAAKVLPLELGKQIQEVFNIIGQAATQIISSIGEIQDAAFEKQMEALEKQTDALEDQLDKQRELTQKYADDVNDIEDELSTARGDRRQHLIDQLNAQIAAQRESAAEEKRIEKEKEKLEKKKEKLEEENNKRKKAQAITTALINAALSISAAAVNNWPLPAIPMIAAATAVGAAQIAAVKAAKYADGGVLQGKSHRQGGIKLLNGYAEAEGGEYITNKRTTARNVDLLDYINSKKRRIDLSDMIEFYESKSRKNIRNMSKTYFADGGYVPTLRNDININDKVVTAMEQYAERPTYVEVVDIINKADNVRRVQTLAGIQ